MTARAQQFKEDKKLSAAISAILVECNLDSSYNVNEKSPAFVSIAVIQFKKKPILSGVYLDSFIYPASMYKLFVAMEVLKQADAGKVDLFQPYIVRFPNDVDKVKEITSDPRPLLKAGDTVTINYLLDLMISRSDNSAANCLIDVAGRENINQTINSMGWQGSEVTRKFLNRKWEDPGYETIRGTTTCARHFAELLFRIEAGQLISQKISRQLKALLTMQLDKSKLAEGLPTSATFSHKTGWWSFFTHDAGIVEDGELKYIIAVFTPIAEDNLNGRLKMLSGKIHSLLLQHNKK